ncbi:MAG TPA: hypothetical protein VMV18_10705, partial [bacterium]|nr:hypothetical protein [bacterium]
AGVLAVAVLLVAGGVGGRRFFPGETDNDGGMITHTPAVATPTDAATATAVASETPFADESPTPASTATTSPATPTPRATRVAIATPRPTAKLIPTPVAPTPTPRVDVAPAATGLVKLDSDPWGEIFVDGKDIGRQTPAFDLRLPEGKHEIRLVNNVQKLETHFSVVVDAKTPQKMVVKLSPAP